MPPLGCLRPRLGARPLRQHTRELVDASHAVLTARQGFLQIHRLPTSSKTDPQAMGMDESLPRTHVDASGASLAQSSKPHRRQQAAHMFHRRQGREQTYLVGQGRQAGRSPAPGCRRPRARGRDAATPKDAPTSTSGAAKRGASTLNCKRATSGKDLGRVGSTL
ncbi:unnamed protein product [Prorocentrum cordatum]|uniref:Uncharacterized protein n=1 Tax=Prorocentrum cordatum TaxID=2364126 RepID=A0ABN9T1U7_9DINO|nr:unnamed protein product [Polarella glacialis]